MKTNFLHVAILSFAAALAARAQVPGATQQIEDDRQRRQLRQTAEAAQENSVPEFYPGESSDVGPVSILKTKPRRTWFEASADVQYFHNDNVLLTENNKEDAGEAITTVQFALAPMAFDLYGGKFAPRLGFRHQWYNFGMSGDKISNTDIKFSDLDFDAQTLFTDARWSRANWTFSAGFEHTRLMDSDDHKEFYNEAVPRWGVQRLIPLCGKASLNVGYAGDYRFTRSDPTSLTMDFHVNDRTDHSLFVALNYSLCSHALLQPYYRFQYTSFTSSSTDREDLLHSVGVSLYIFATKNFSLRVFVAQDFNDSGGSNGRDYERLTVGGGLNLVFRF